MQIAKEAMEKRISSMVDESAERQKRFDKLLVDFQKEKETLIENCLFENKETINLMQLRLLSLTKYGLVSNQWRKRAWPKFVAGHLGIWKTASLPCTEQSLHHPTRDEISHIKELVAGCEWNSKGIKKQESSRIQHPGRRVSFRLQELAFSTDKQKDRKVLRKVLIHLKRMSPMYEPTEATCCAIALLLAVLESSSMTSIVVQQLVSYQWKIHNTCTTALQEKLLHLLQTFSPRLFQHFSFIGIHNVPFIIHDSWIPSWFAQNIADATLLARIWDVLMVSHPDCILYICVSLITEFESVLRVENDSEALTRRLLQLPGQLDATDVEVVLFQALIWMRDDPPREIMGAPEWFQATLAPTDDMIVRYAKALRVGTASIDKRRVGWSDDGWMFLDRRDSIVGGARDYPLVLASMGFPIGLNKISKKKSESGRIRIVMVTLLVVLASVVLYKSKSTFFASAACQVDAIVSDILNQNWTKLRIHQTEGLVFDGDSRSLMDSKVGKLAGEILPCLETAAPESDCLDNKIEPPEPDGEATNDPRGLVSPPCEHVSLGTVAAIDHSNGDVQDTSFAASDRVELSVHQPVAGLLDETNAVPNPDTAECNDPVVTNQDIRKKMEDIYATETPEIEVETNGLLQDGNSYSAEGPDYAIEADDSNHASPSYTTETQANKIKVDEILEVSRLGAIRLAHEASQQTKKAAQMAKDMVSQYLADAIRLKGEGVPKDGDAKETPFYETSGEDESPVYQPPGEFYGEDDALPKHVTKANTDSAATIDSMEEEEVEEEHSNIQADPLEEDALPNHITEANTDSAATIDSMEEEEVEEEHSNIQADPLEEDALPNHSTEARTDSAATIESTEIERVEIMSAGQNSSFVDTDAKDTKGGMDKSHVNEELEHDIDGHAIVENRHLDVIRLGQEASRHTQTAFQISQNIVSRYLMDSNQDEPEDEKVAEDHGVLVNKEESHDSSNQETVAKKPIQIVSIQLREPFFSKDDVTSIFEQMMNSSIDLLDPRRRRRRRRNGGWLMGKWHNFGTI